MWMSSMLKLQFFYESLLLLQFSAFVILLQGLMFSTLTAGHD